MSRCPSFIFTQVSEAPKFLYIEELPLPPVGRLLVKRRLFHHPWAALDKLNALQQVEKALPKDEYLYIPHESKRAVTSSRKRILFSLPKDYFLAGQPARSL